MFKKYYKMAFDEIQPNRELIDEIFTKAEKNKKSISAVNYKYGMAAAALLVIAVSVYSYPKITDYADINNKTAQPDIAKTENLVNSLPAPADNVAEEQSEKEQSMNSAKMTEKSIVYDTNAPIKYNAETENLPAAASADAGEETALMMRASGGAAKNSTTVVWDIEKYKEYLGVDVESIIKLPENFKNTTENSFYVIMQDNEIQNDLAAFSFTAEEKLILVETSKLVNMSDGKETVKLSDDEYEAYFENNGIYFRVYSKGIDETELKAVVESISG